MPGSAATPGSATILLVDDEESVRSIVTKILRRGGYTVLEADSGAGALVLAKTHPARIDMVITDLHMPGAQGPEVVKQLLAVLPELRVLFISGYADHDVVARTGVAGGANFLHKPFSGKDLTAAVEAALS
jgi:DNA-binding NtrC family response regulator